MSLTSAITHNSILDITTAVRNLVEYEENGTPFRFDTFLLPSEGDEQTVLDQGGLREKEIQPGLKMLLDETRDFLERYCNSLIF